MKDDDKQREGTGLFEIMEPPAGGLEAMRRRLERRGRPGAAAPLIAFACAAALLAAVLYFGQPLQPEPALETTAEQGTAPDAGDSAESSGALVADQEPADTNGNVDELAVRSLDRLLGRSWQPQPVRVTSGERQIAARELESTDPKVKIYEIDCGDSPCMAGAPDL